MREYLLSQRGQFNLGAGGPLNLLIWLIVILVFIVILFRYVLPAIAGH